MRNSYKMVFPHYTEGGGGNTPGFVSNIKTVRMITGCGLKEARDIVAANEPFGYVGFVDPNHLRTLQSGGVVVTFQDMVKKTARELLVEAAKLCIDDGDLGAAIEILEIARANMNNSLQFRS